MPPAARIAELALVMQVARFQQSDVIEIPAASDQSNVVHASLAICVRRLLVGKRVQGVWEKKRKKGKKNNNNNK